MTTKPPPRLPLPSTICFEALKLPGTRIPCLCNRPPGHDGPHFCGICSNDWTTELDDESDSPE